jgi:flagellar protein FliO/FliZ
MAFSQENVVEEQLDSQTIETQTVTVANETSLDTITQSNTTKSPEVGKHVMANMDAGSMILSLLMVLALIIICAFILKRFNLTQQGVSQLRVITSLSLGAKERIMVVQMGEQQLLLGVTAQKITLLDKLAEPLAETTMGTVDLPKNLLSFLSAKKL